MKNVIEKLSFEKCNLMKILLFEKKCNLRRSVIGENVILMKNEIWKIDRKCYSIKKCNLVKK